jgi:hypothetical protein
MASPLRSAILRGFEEPYEQETPKQESAEKEKAAPPPPPPPKPGLGALARAIGRGREVKKVTIIGGQSDKGPKHGAEYPYDKTRVWDAVKKKWVPRASLGEGPDKPVYDEKK